MMFGGGLISTYLLIRALGLLDSSWVLIIPHLISAFNLVIIKGFFEQLPTEIEESARVDGASELQSLWRIMPLQVVLRNILLLLNVATQSADSIANSGTVSKFAVQMAAVVVTTIPILIVYPFMPKTFY